jgi:hypothetical protein
MTGAPPRRKPPKPGLPGPAVTRAVQARPSRFTEAWSICASALYRFPE